MLLDCTKVLSVRAKRPFINLPLGPRHSMQVQTMRKRRREGNEWAARVERRYTIQRAIRWLKNRSSGAHNSLRVPRQDPPLLPSIIFPLGPPFCGDECRAERALGCGRIFGQAAFSV